MSLSITWLGHSTFILTLPSGQRVLTDPWLGNPKCPEKFAKPDALKPIQLILLSHGHNDHACDLIPVARATGAAVVCIHEAARFFGAKGLQNVNGMNIGGRQNLAGLSVTMTAAVHSSGFDDGGHVVYLGEPAGYVLSASSQPTIYFAGDTGLFGDMKMIGELYRPEIAFLPIGDRYTMGPDAAAIAARWLGVRQVVPMHWGTSPELTGTPETLIAELKGTGIDVLRINPGETAVGT